jgi:hypothetical protein
MKQRLGMMLSNFSLDLDVFSNQLYVASKESLGLMKSNYQGVKLYSFALVTTGLFGYVFPNGNTEECVLEAARMYLDQTGDFGIDIELAKKYCRWEPSPYWRFFQAYYEPFEEVNSMVENIPSELSRLNEQEFDEAGNRIEEALFDVLRRLDKEGEFGSGPTRESFYVNISYQDQSYEDLHRCAKAVNPTQVSDLVWSDLADVMRFWDENRAS